MLVNPLEIEVQERQDAQNEKGPYWTLFSKMLQFEVERLAVPVLGLIVEFVVDIINWVPVGTGHSKLSLSFAELGS